jgi:cytoskeletal protein RodZ
LTEELGLEPSPALKELEQAILRQDPSLDANALPPPTEQPMEEPDPERRRLPPVALLALVALGLAGAATVIALVRPGEGSGSRTATEAIFETLTSTTTNPTTDTHRTTDAQKTTTAENRTAAPAHTTANSATTTSNSVTTTSSSVTTTSSSVTTTTKQISVIRPATTVAHKADNKNEQVAAPPKPVTITDDFSGSSMNPQIWILAPPEGTGVDLAQTNGQLELTMQADATPNPQWNAMSAGYWTACTLGGDFDAQIDYTLLDWPAANGTVVALGVSWPGVGNVINLVRASRSSGQEDYTFAAPSGESRTLDTTDESGGLRMTRVGALVTSYIRVGGRWESFYSARYRGFVTLQFVLWASGSDFAHKDVSVAFDNFVLKAPVIPAASAC